MATMVLQYLRQTLQSRGNEIVPYRPLDIEMTPQEVPPMEAPSARLLDRVDDFYQDLRDEEAGRCSSSSSSRSSSRSRSRSRSPQRKNNFGSQPAVVETPPEQPP